MPGLFQINPDLFLREEGNQSSKGGQNDASTDCIKFNAVLNHFSLRSVAVQNCLCALHINRISRSTRAEIEGQPCDMRMES